MALSLIIPAGIGYWLDNPRVLNKNPLFTLIGLGVGTVIAFGGLIRMLLRYQAEQEDQRKNKEQNKKREWVAIGLRFLFFSLSLS